MSSLGVELAMRFRVNYNNNNNKQLIFKKFDKKPNWDLKPFHNMNLGLRIDLLSTELTLLLGLDG